MAPPMSDAARKALRRSTVNMNVLCFTGRAGGTKPELTEVLSSAFKSFFPLFSDVMFPAGADATETSCQLVETEHGLKVGLFPKGKLPRESTCDCTSRERTSVGERQSNRLRI